MELIDREAVIKYQDDLGAILEQGTLSERKAFLRSFIQSIKKGDTQVTINYTLPVPQAQVPIDHLGVLDTASLGGVSYS